MPDDVNTRITELLTSYSDLQTQLVAALQDLEQVRLRCITALDDSQTARNKATQALASIEEITGADLSGLATKEEIALLATKAEIADFLTASDISDLATKAEDNAKMPLAGGTFTGGYFGKSFAPAAAEIAVNEGSICSMTISGDTTLAFTGAPADSAACFTLILTDGGAATVTWPASVKWSADQPPELTETGIDVLTFITADGGLSWYGMHSLKGAENADADV